MRFKPSCAFLPMKRSKWRRDLGCHHVLRGYGRAVSLATTMTTKKEEAK